MHNNNIICQNKWQRNERNEQLCVGEPLGDEAHPVIWTSCSRIKAPLLDEESHVLCEQEVFNATMLGPVIQGAELVQNVE